MSFPSYPQAFLPDQRWWEIANERRRQFDALTRIGEYSMFVLMWTVRDFKAGRVLRCPNCEDVLEQTKSSAAAEMIQDVYKQPSQDRCPVCFGTFYVGPAGGVKAILVRPCIWQFSEEQVTEAQRGAVETQQGSVTTTGDFRMQPHDYIFRSDGRRFEVSQAQATHLASGFGNYSSSDTAVTVAYTVAEENASSPAFLIGPDAQGLMSMLNPPYARQQPDFSQYEFTDGPVVL